MVAGAVFGWRTHRHSVLALRVSRDPVAHLPREVQSLAIVLEDIDDPQALLVVIESAGHECVEHALPRVTEGRVAQIVSESDGLGQFLVQAQDLGDRARDLRHFERMREPRPIVIAGRRKKHLRLVFQAPERLGVDDAIAIALKGRADRILVFLPQSSLAFGALRCLRRQDLALAGLELLANRQTGRAHEAAMTCERKLVPFASGPTPRASASV